jgi:hypothetical protein
MRLGRNDEAPPVRWMVIAVWKGQRTEAACDVD